VHRVEEQRAQEIRRRNDESVTLTGEQLQAYRVWQRSCISPCQSCNPCSFEGLTCSPPLRCGHFAPRFRGQSLSCRIMYV
jgi:hypothetical protein